MIVAAIASTAFVLFISPESASAQPSHALGGHMLAIIVGSALALVVDTGVGTALAIVAHGFAWDLVAFVALAVLIMVGVHRALRGKLVGLF